MKKIKTKLKLCIAIGMAALACLSLALYCYINREDKIKLGMSLEEAVAILEKQNYSYEIREFTGLSYAAQIHVEEVVFREIGGSLYIDIGFDDKVSHIFFESDMTDEKVAILDKYLYGLYGEPTHDEVEERILDVVSLWFHKDDMAIGYSYPTDENTLRTNIAVSWLYRSFY